jgi:heat shock protein HslJ
VKKHVRIVFGMSALAAVISMAACAQTIAPSATAPSEAATAAAALTGAWKLQSLTRPDSTVVPVSEPDRFTIQFSEGSRFAFRADCNRGNGGYTAAGNAISVGAVAITKAYCVETAPFDNEYVGLLTGDNVVTATAASLTLSSSRGTLRFIK